MPIAGAVKEIEREYGKPFDEVLVSILNEFQTEMRAAAALNVYPNTIRHHRNKLNIVRGEDGTWYQDTTVREEAVS